MKTKRENSDADERREYKKYCSRVYSIAAVFAALLSLGAALVAPTAGAAFIFSVLIWGGVFWVASYHLNDNPQDSQQVQCRDCHRMYRRSHHARCPKCGST